MEGRVRQFITTNFYVADAGVLTADTSLLDSGIVDSTGVLEIIAFLEGEIGITVADEEMTPENLDSIGKIAHFVARKKS
ncbi:MAG TPA: acyl carrier protein [Polyangiaceae bacterium]|nr:acyl carrier protein [Polyangiaceae bacterium]